MVYEIFTYGGGNYLVEVLNALVRIMNGNAFTTALKISLMFGLFSILFDIAMNGNFTKGIKYYISFLLIYNLLFVPKVDVIITDPINQIRTDRKVDNIPFGLGFMAHTISSLGNWMTDIFGMNFALPNDLQYNKNGILLGSKIINDTLNTRMTDDRTNGNINNYIRQCIIPAIALKKIKIEDYLKSASIQEFLKFGKNGVLAYTYTNTNNIRTITLCNNITELQKDFNIEINKLIQKQNNKFNNGNNIGNTIDINNVNQYVLGIQTNITKIFEQNLIANAINDSTQDYLSIVGADAGAINYAITKDNLQRKQNSILQWIQANTFLPLLKIIIEVIFYSLFPLVILLALLPNGFKLIKNYFLILLTLQLWSPLYAILNLIMTLEQKYRLTNLLGQTEEIISLYNRQAIMDITQGIQMQAGLLAFMIPSISFKITQGMQSFGEGLTSSIVSSNTCTTGNLAGEISSGNLSYGNGSFKNMAYSNTNANQFKAMRLNLVSGEDLINSSNIALNKAKSTNQTWANNYNKSMENLQSLQFQDSSGNGKTHSFNSDFLVKEYGGIGGNFGIGKVGIDLEAAQKWASANNISEEDKKILTDSIQKHNFIQNSYNQSISEVYSKQRALNHIKNTSTHSGADWNKEGYDYLKEQGYSDEWIDNHLLEAQRLCHNFISQKYFNNKTPNMLNDINNSLEINKGNYDNQNNMIDSQYNYDKNRKNSMKMLNSADVFNFNNFKNNKNN